MAPCPDCDAANARAREMHRRAQVAEGEAKRLREALALTEAALAKAQLERGLAQADRTCAEVQRRELLRRLELFDNTVCWNVECAHSADALDLHVLLDQLRDVASSAIHAMPRGRDAAMAELARVVALSPIPTRAPIDLQCPVCGVGKRPEDACPFCATEGK